MSRLARTLLIAVVVLAAYFLVIYVLGAEASGAKPKMTRVCVSAGNCTEVRTSLVRRGEVASITVETTESLLISDSRRRGKCKEVNNRHHARNPFGSVLYWWEVRKYWCYRERKGVVTYAPKGQLSESVTTLGGLVGWDDQGVRGRINEFRTWHLRPGGSHYSWGKFKFRRCIATPIGSACIGSATKQIWTYGYGNGYHERGGS